MKNNLKKILIIVICILTIITVLLIAANVLKKPVMKLMYPIKYTEYVNKYSEEYNVDEQLIYAVIKAESNFKEQANSSRNAKGLMQLIDSTAQDVARILKIEYSSEKLLEPETNIQLGTKYLSNLITKYGNIELALAAYNAGSGNVDNWIRNGTLQSDGTDIENVPYKETNNYIRKILRDYKIYQELY